LVVLPWYNFRMTLTDFPEVRALSAREKLQLVDELWVSVAPELDALEVSEEEKRVLDERWAAFLKNPAAALTVEQFQQKMKPLRG
jgi:putative addiction module component (TIGR02574 family)